MSQSKTNQLPFGVHYDAESDTSTIYDRLYKPIVVLPKKWPRCDRGAAVACDGPPLYGVKPIHTFYRPDDGNAAVCDPIVRKRLRSLVEGMPALKAELRRRAATPARTQTASHADLVSLTFNVAAN
jgi:hypothetical protein